MMQIMYIPCASTEEECNNDNEVHLNCQPDGKPIDVTDDADVVKAGTRM